MWHNPEPNIQSEDAWAYTKHHSLELAFDVCELYAAICRVVPIPQEDWVGRAYALAALWNAGRIQGIRDERKRRAAARQKTVAFDCEK